jgi:hypothetical protein
MKQLQRHSSSLAFRISITMREVGKNKHQDLWIRALEDNFENKGPAWGRNDFENILAGFEVRFPSVWFLTGMEHCTRSMLTRWI